LEDDMVSEANKIDIIHQDNAISKIMPVVAIQVPARRHTTNTAVQRFAQAAQDLIDKCKRSILG